MLIADAHLDLAYNALRNREVLKSAAEQHADDEGIPTVGLPDLQAGGISLICATLFAMPSVDGKPGYRTAEEAHGAVQAQLAWYQQQVSVGRLRLVHGRDDLQGQSGSLSAILLLEGADPIRTPDDLTGWFDAGLRIVGLAWGHTRYAGGTRAPGPLTALGVELIPHLDGLGIIHDLSHLADESFWQLLDRTNGPVMASHSNCRAIVPTDRQLSDEMIRAIVERDGVIGINLYDKFLLPPDVYGKRRANLSDVLKHIDHICQLAGDARHVALGTDMDGGLGRDEIPEEIVTSADLPKVAEALGRAGYGAADLRGVMGLNWLQFFRGALPGG